VTFTKGTMIGPCGSRLFDSFHNPFNGLAKRLDLAQGHRPTVSEPYIGRKSRD
jgi:hypothetical protein